MKRLYILRHAKAEQASRKISSDHDRPLNSKGIDGCALLGEYLTAQKARMDFILCSDALRTRQTVLHILQQIKKTIPTEYNRKLYLASPQQIMSELRDVDNAYDNVMVVGHNPGIHQFAISVADEGEAKLLNALIENFPTGALATVEFDCESWWDLPQAKGILTDFTAPKFLKQ